MDPNASLENFALSYVARLLETEEDWAASFDFFFWFVAVLFVEAVREKPNPISLGELALHCIALGFGLVIVVGFFINALAARDGGSAETFRIRIASVALLLTYLALTAVDILKSYAPFFVRVVGTLLLAVDTFLLFYNLSFAIAQSDELGSLAKWEQCGTPRE